MRKKNPDRIGFHVSALPRFAAGMLMLPPYLLIQSPVSKTLLAAFCALLAVLSGKRLRWGYYILLVLSVTFFHLLSPWGRVLLEMGPLVITSGALENGLIRGITLTGMVFLSVASVRPELELPGRFGGLLGRTFYYFDSILEGKKRLSGKNFFASLDELLMERFNPDYEKPPMALMETDRTLPGRREWFLCAAVTLIPWGLWVLER